MFPDGHSEMRTAACLVTGKPIIQRVQDRTRTLNWRFGLAQ